MLDRVIFFVGRVIEIVFFTGLCGCAVVITVSWVSIFRDGFTRDREE
jgi:hypothetical protein